MEANEDMVVVIIGDGDGNEEGEEFAPPQTIEIKEEKLEDVEETEYIQSLIDKAEQHGEYLEGDYMDVLGIKKEELLNENTEDGIREYDEEYLNDNEYLPDDNDYLSDEYCVLNDSNSDTDKEIRDKGKYSTKRGILTRKTTFISKWRKKNPKYAFNKKKLIEALVDHMRNAKPPPPPKDYFIMEGINFVCIYCGDNTGTLPAAGRHYQVKHGQRYLECYSCGMDFRSTTNFYKHEKRCPEPDAITVLKARALYLGRKGKGRPFLSTAASQIQVQKRSGSWCAGSKQRSFLCESCPAMFQTATALGAHTRLHNGVRPYACNRCGVRYTSASTLTRHLKTHTDIEMICDHCGRSFKIKAALVAHMYTHAPVRKYPCTECDRRFAQKAALLLHVNRVHRGLPLPFACEICAKRYPRMSLLKKHMKSTHGMQLMTRNMFFKALPKMSNADAMRHAKIIFKSNYANSPMSNELANNDRIKPSPQKIVATKNPQMAKGQEIDEKELQLDTLGEKTQQLGKLLSVKQVLGTQSEQKLNSSRQETNYSELELGQSDQMTKQTKEIKEKEFQITDSNSHTTEMKYVYVNDDVENGFIIIQDGEELELNDETKQNILQQARAMMNSEEETVFLVQEDDIDDNI